MPVKASCFTYIFISNSKQHGFCEALPKKLRIAFPQTMVAAMISQVGHNAYEETQKFIHEDNGWAKAEDGSLDQDKIYAYEKEQERKIALCEAQYKENPQYWSALKYFGVPLEQPEVNKRFETHELRLAYKVSGHKALSDFGFSCFAKISWIVAYKICPQ